MSTGNAGSVNEKSLAQILSWVSGVDKVDLSNLDVNPTKASELCQDKITTIRSDLEIQKAVSESLLYDPRVRSSNFSINARMVAISLHGNVVSLAAKQSAEREALNTIGTRRVLNDLKFKEERFPDDLKLTEQAQKAIERDSYLSASKSIASSHFGKVHIMERLTISSNGIVSGTFWQIWQEFVKSSIVSKSICNGLKSPTMKFLRIKIGDFAGVHFWNQPQSQFRSPMVL